MRRRAALIEFSIYDQYPLISGYLHAYAATDPTVAESYDFVYYQEEVERVTYPETLRKLRALEAEILCFSCYVWNMGLIKRLVKDLRRDPKVRHIILGGHQISNHFTQYIDRSDSKTIAVNGQGETPFRAILQRLTASQALSGLQGVSLYVDGELWNGGEAPMIEDLDEIPSPFLEGYLDRSHHPITVFETNRGCPYKCTFCTWGGDTLKVTKFSLERVKAELLWIAKKSVPFIYLGDANWGMLPRDIELSEYIAKLKKDHGHPWMMFYASAKNKPKGSVACIEKFHEGGVITSQAIGIQSMNPRTLELIDRKNIKNSAYIQMFDELNVRNIDSYCELIWPLPGETVDSLKAGFQQLLELGARTVVMYPAILINNARLTRQIGEHRMGTLSCDDWKSELRTVKQTKYVDRAGVDEGFWFYYAHFLLANCDPGKTLLRFLRDATGVDFADLTARFAGALRTAEHPSPYARLIQSIFQEEAHGSLMTIGRLAAHLTHEARLASQAEVSAFVLDALPADPEAALALAGLWSLSFPRLFVDTYDDVNGLVEQLDELGSRHGRRFSELTSISPSDQVAVLELRAGREAWARVLPYFAGGVQSPPALRVLEIHHPGSAGRLPYYPNDLNRNFVYAHGMIQRLGFLAARTKVADA
jgi:tRNA A37 methylthiotransferase MiaB